MGENDWEFQAGDRVEEASEFQVSIGEMRVTTSKRTIKRRLVDVSDNERFYHVENEFGDTHLYSAGVIEGTYREVGADNE